MLTAGANEWLPKWRANGFINCKGNMVANADPIIRLSNLIQSRQARVYFIHVAGHDGDPGNEMADVSEISTCTDDSNWRAMEPKHIAGIAPAMTRVTQTTTERSHRSGSCSSPQSLSRVKEVNEKGRSLPGCY